MKIWHISDTHTFHNLLEIPADIDMVIFSGDCSNPKDPYPNEVEVRGFIDWYRSLKIQYKIFVAGNHDTSIEKKFVTSEDFARHNIIYLENEDIIIDGVKIFGSPYTPLFGNWAFMKARHKLDRVWDSAIPDDSDIVVVHGPPKGILDLSFNRRGGIERCGDKSLLNRVKDVNPKLCLFGHIHNCEDIINQGTMKLSNLDTIFSNGSVMKDGRFGKLTSNGNILEI